MVRVALGLEYNGASFKGWQRQVGAITVQDCLEVAVSKVADHAVAVVAAGRTDTGVHASGQVAHFDSDSVRGEHGWQRGINTLLPKPVRVLWVREADESFHARFSATQRSYRYVLLNRSTQSGLFHGAVGWDHRPLDAALISEAAKTFVGEHDFSAFRAAGCQARTPIHTISEFQVGQQGEWWWFDISADAFLQHMVRNLVGVLLAIGAGERPVEWAAEVLASHDRCAGGVTASPDGLYLVSVGYPERFAIPEPPAPVCFW